MLRPVMSRIYLTGVHVNFVQFIFVVAVVHIGHEKRMDVELEAEL
jgi:hypothetical protein